MPYKSIQNLDGSILWNTKPIHPFKFVLFGGLFQVAHILIQFAFTLLHLAAQI